MFDSSNFTPAPAAVTGPATSKSQSIATLPREYVIACLNGVHRARPASPFYGPAFDRYVWVYDAFRPMGWTHKLDDIHADHHSLQTRALALAALVLKNDIQFTLDARSNLVAHPRDAKIVLAASSAPAIR